MKSAQYISPRRIEVHASEVILPSRGEVRLEVAFCGICGTDMHIFHGAMDQRVARPQILGHEVSAMIADVGDGVNEFVVGQRVAVRPLQFGEPVAFDRGFAHVGKNLQFIGIDSPGGMQSSWTVPAYTLHVLPENLSLEHGAMIEPAAVACHDVRLAEVADDEACVVIGGGPIGLLIALVARHKGARVLLAEVNDSRVALAESLGFAAINPTREDVITSVEAWTGGAMADCVFEVSGSRAGAEVMTELLGARGRIVMVAIHPEPKPVNLFKFFWSELRMIGTRLYEEVDFDEAIRLAASGCLALDRLITAIEPIHRVHDTFCAIDENPSGIKYLIDCRA